MNRPLYLLACIGAMATSYLTFAYHDATVENTTPQDIGGRVMQWQKLYHKDMAFTVEVARTRAQHQQGLMGRDAETDNLGMLFVFDTPGEQCFWMKETPQPLSVAFLAENGEILHVAKMTPHSRAPHCSPEPVSMALEMPQGWFAQHRIRAGDHLDL